MQHSSFNSTQRPSLPFKATAKRGSFLHSLNRRTFIKAGAGLVASLITQKAHAAPLPTHPPLIVISGNSISACQPAARPYFEMALTDERIAGFLPAVVNASVAGWGVDNLMYTAPMRVYPLIDSWPGQRIVVIWEGTNHLGSVKTARESWEVHAAYADALRRRGAQVIIGTILKRVQLPEWQFDHNAMRLAWNEIARAEWMQHADALMDVATDPTLIESPAPDPAYWLDGAHPNSAGHALIAPYLVNALLSLLQKPVTLQAVKPSCLALPLVGR